MAYHHAPHMPYAAATGGDYPTPRYGPPDSHHYPPHYSSSESHHYQQEYDDPYAPPRPQVAPPAHYNSPPLAHRDPLHSAQAAHYRQYPSSQYNAPHPSAQYNPSHPSAQYNASHPSAPYNPPHPSTHNRYDNAYPSYPDSGYDYEGEQYDPSSASHERIASHRAVSIERPSPGYEANSDWRGYSGYPKIPVEPQRGGLQPTSPEGKQPLRREQVEEQNKKSVASDDSNSEVPEGSVASTVGSQWRTIPDRNRGKKMKEVHPTEVAPPLGKRLGLLIGVDDSFHAAHNSCQLMEQFLRIRGFHAETVLDTGENSEQFDADIEAGIGEMIALSKPGDALFLYAINYGPDGRGHSASALLHQLAENLPSKVRLTCVFDCCYLTSKPAFKMDYRVTKIGDPKWAGLKHFRRKAEKTGPVAVTVAADIFVFNGENPSGKCMTINRRNAYQGIFTAAWLKTIDNPELKSSVRGSISYARLARGLEVELERIAIGDNSHGTKSEILCCKAYDVDQVFIV